LKSGRRDGSGGLAPGTVRNIHRVLRRALQQGVAWQELGRNVAELASPPRVARQEMKVVDEREMLELFELFAGKQLYRLSSRSALQACAGARR
jgi:hypothetical protein